jgi:transposase
VRALRSAARIGAEGGERGAEHRARRSRFRHDDYLRFLDDLSIPRDDNAAEREIRMVEVRQKVSGSLRTLTGAQHFATIRSHLATAVKHRDRS